MKEDRTIGGKPYKKGQPVFYLDTAKTSTMEGAATTVYATGGRGNTRLIAWEGERTLTFTVEDALLSPISFTMLSGAGLVKGAAGSSQIVHFHQTSTAEIGDGGVINLNDALAPGETICSTAPIYVMKIDNYGDLTGDLIDKFTVPASALENVTNSGARYLKWNGTGTAPTGAVMVDYYVKKSSTKVSELQIDAEHFGGYFYVEADTLFRSRDGKDYPANLTFPSVKIQSNFTFSMAATGDPSTFTFTMDAFPGYTYFDNTKRVLCAIQIADDNAETSETQKTIFPHPTSAVEDGYIKESEFDSVNGTETNEYDELPG